LSSPADDRALLAEAAGTAAEIALRFFRRAPRAWEKSGGAGPVSEADLAVDAALAERLRAARPDYGWLSEESADDKARLERARIFVVDPIDGTRAFLGGETGWCVAAAVIEDGAPVAAVAAFPALGTVYLAARGAGAMRDGAPIRAPEGAALGGATVFTASDNLREDRWPGGAPPVKRSFSSSMIQRLCHVGDGTGDATFAFRRIWEWDLAAGALIAAEAGCAVTDGDGAPMRFNSPEGRVAGLMAAPPALHAALMARRRPADRERD